MNPPDLNYSPLGRSPFGVRIDNVDCADIDDVLARTLRQALYEHQVLVIPGQSHLTPEEEVRFYKALDDQADTVWRDQVNNPWEVYKVERGNTAGTWQLPREPGVLVLGKGEIDHHGLRVNLGGDREAYGDDEGSQVLGGGALQWHIDGAFYKSEPCQFTQMVCVEPPRGSGHWLQYDDASGARLWCDAGSTAFASGRLGFQLLDEKDQQTARKLDVHYLANPFQTTMNLGNNGNGLRVVDPEREAQYESGSEQPGIDVQDSDAKIYPMIWTCPATGLEALMPHPRCMSHLKHRTEGTALGTTESRLLAERLMRPAIEPLYVYVHPWKAGDLVIWYNRAVWHSATGKLSRDDRRIQHLTAFNSARPPA